MTIAQHQGQISAQGILHLRNPNLGPSSRKQILDTRISDPNSWFEFFILFFFKQKRPPEKFTLKKFTSQNSPFKIQPRNREKLFTLHWEPVDHLQGSLGPSGPETPKKSEKKSPGASGPGTPRESGKSLEKSGESGKSLEKVPKDFFETFSRLSGGPGAGGPGRLFSDFFGVSRARRARETPVNGQRVPKHCTSTVKTFISSYRTPGPRKGFSRGLCRGL